MLAPCTCPCVLKFPALGIVVPAAAAIAPPVHSNHSNHYTLPPTHFISLTRNLPLIFPVDDDNNSTSGTFRFTPADFLGNATAWAKEGWAVATHAIGDAANRLVLDTYEEVRSTLGPEVVDPLRCVPLSLLVSARLSISCRKSHASGKSFHLSPLPRSPQVSSGTRADCELQ